MCVRSLGMGSSEFSLLGRSEYRFVLNAKAQMPAVSQNPLSKGKVLPSDVLFVKSERCENSEIPDTGILSSSLLKLDLGL